MSFVNLRESNKTIMVISLFVLFLYGYLALSGLGLVQISRLLGSPLGVGIVLLVGALVLATETLFEGAKPDWNTIMRFKEPWTTLNVAAALLIGLAAILTLANMAVPLWMSAILPYSYVAVFVLIAKELVFD